MTRLFLLCLLLLIWSTSLHAQSGNGGAHTFTAVREVKTTPVKNQAGSGTCWAYSLLSFMESELLRMGKPEYDLAEMWIVRHTYPAKAEKYMRLHGSLNLAAGGSFEDVLWVMRHHGIVPQDAYSGLDYGRNTNEHSELDAAVKAYTDAVLKTADSYGSRGLTTAWMNGLEGIVDAYLGRCPEKFAYGGTEYTPMTFLQSLGLNLDDYVSITSYTHHPFYRPFVLEVPDNWIWGLSCNVPMNEMLEIINNALNTGYSVAWAADVSEKGFARGLAMVPEMNPDGMPDPYSARRPEMSDGDLELQTAGRDTSVTERQITQEMRQAAFDNFQTTDDHGMHIVGTAKDRNGNTFYRVKNSWGTDNSAYDGYLYASEAYILYKTMSILVHKDALPKHTANRLGIK